MKRGDNSKDNDLNLAALENILIGAYDAFVEENVEIRSQAGLTETITREAIGGCCEWCSKLAGTYRYGEEPKEIYQKHDNCTCVVTAKTDKGYTDVWSKKQYQSQKEARIGRVNEILKEQSDRAEIQRANRGELSVKSGNDNIQAKQITTGEEAALNTYTSAESYIINELLRKNQELGAWEDVIGNLDNALKKMPTYEGNLYRTMKFISDADKRDFLNSVQVDKKIQFKAYTSTSKKVGYNDDADVFVIIQNSSKGRDIEKYNPLEHEVLYERDSEFVCKYKDELKGDRILIILEEA